MRHLRLCLLFSYILSFTLIAGCGADSGPGKPVADKNKIDAYLAEHPEENTDEEEEMDEAEE